MHITRQHLHTLNNQYRARLINSLSGFKSANLVGTADAEGHSNLSIVSSVFHIGADPALVGMIIRPHSVPRHSFENILQTGVYTINHVSESMWQQAHQTSARYPREVSEFAAVGLSEQYLPGCSAPFVAQSKLKYALKLQEVVHLAINGTELVLGEVQDILVDDHAVQEDGYIDIEGLNTVALSGLDSYHISQRLSRLAYAKPDLAPRPLSLSGEELPE